MLHKLRDNERLSAEGKISQAEFEAVQRRVDTVSYCMMAEINHFHQERVDDFKQTMTTFLTKQVDFYRDIAAQLQGALAQFES